MRIPNPNQFRRIGSSLINIVKECGPDILNDSCKKLATSELMQDILGAFLEKKIVMGVVDKREDTYKSEDLSEQTHSTIYYGMGDHFYEHARIDLGGYVRINSEEIGLFGELMFIENGQKWGTALIPTLASFTPRPNDRTSTGYNIDSYCVEVELLKEHVKVTFYGYLVGHNGAPMSGDGILGFFKQHREALAPPLLLPWWATLPSSDDHIYNDCIKTRVSK